MTCQQAQRQISNAEIVHFACDAVCLVGEMLTIFRVVDVRYRQVVSSKRRCLTSDLQGVQRNTHGCSNKSDEATKPGEVVSGLLK